MGDCVAVWKNGGTIDDYEIFQFDGKAYVSADRLKTFNPYEVTAGTHRVVYGKSEEELRQSVEDARWERRGQVLDGGRYDFKCPKCSRKYLFKHKNVAWNSDLHDVANCRCGVKMNITAHRAISFVVTVRE